MRLPLENILQIVEAVADDDADGADNAGSILRHLDGFSRASRLFRHVALRTALRTLRFCAPVDWAALGTLLPAAYVFVRILHCPLATAACGQFEHFTSLRGLHLSGPSVNLVDLISRLPHTIMDITLPFDHAQDHAGVLQAAARQFPELRSLRVSRSEFEVLPPSIPFIEDEDVPPHHYAYSLIASQLLAPLPHLCRLQIDHYLTHTDCVEFHKVQCPWGSPAEPCLSCFARFGYQTARAEEACTRIMAEALASLEVVMWKNWFTELGEGYSCVWIRRGECGLSVSREREAVEKAWWKLVGDVSYSPLL